MIERIALQRKQVSVSLRLNCRHGWLRRSQWNVPGVVTIEPAGVVMCRPSSRYSRWRSPECVRCAACGGFVAPGTRLRCRRLRRLRDSAPESPRPRSPSPRPAPYRASWDGRRRRAARRGHRSSAATARVRESPTCGNRDRLRARRARRHESPRTQLAQFLARRPSPTTIPS